MICSYNKQNNQPYWAKSGATLPPIALANFLKVWRMAQDILLVLYDRVVIGLMTGITKTIRRQHDIIRTYLRVPTS